MDINHPNSNNKKNNYTHQNSKYIHQSTQNRNYKFSRNNQFSIISSIKKPLTSKSQLSNNIKQSDNYSNLSKTLSNKTDESSTNFGGDLIAIKNKNKNITQNIKTKNIRNNPIKNNQNNNIRKPINKHNKIINKQNINNNNNLCNIPNKVYMQQNINKSNNNKNLINNINNKDIQKNINVKKNNYINNLNKKNKDDSEDDSNYGNEEDDDFDTILSETLNKKNNINNININKNLKNNPLKKPFSKDYKKTTKPIQKLKNKNNTFDNNMNINTKFNKNKNKMDNNINTNFDNINQISDETEKKIYNKENNYYNQINLESVEDDKKINNNIINFDNMNIINENNYNEIPNNDGGFFGKLKCGFNFMPNYLNMNDYFFDNNDFFQENNLNNINIFQDNDNNNNLMNEDNNIITNPLNNLDNNLNNYNMNISFKDIINNNNINAINNENNIINYVPKIDLSNPDTKNQFINHNLSIEQMLKDIKFFERLKSISDSRYSSFINKYQKNNYFMEKSQFENIFIDEKSNKVHNPLTLAFHYIFNPGTILSESGKNFFETIFTKRGDKNYSITYNQFELGEIPKYFNDFSYVNNLFHNFNKDDLNSFLEEINSWKETFSFEQQFIHPLYMFRREKSITMKDVAKVYFISPYDLIIDYHSYGSDLPLSDTFIAITQYRFHCDINYNSKKGKFIFKSNAQILNTIKLVKETLLKNTIRNESNSTNKEELQINTWPPLKAVIESEDKKNQKIVEQIYNKYLYDNLNKFSKELPKDYDIYKVEYGEKWSDLSEEDEYSNNNEESDEDNYNYYKRNMDERNSIIIKYVITFCILILFSKIYFSIGNGSFSFGTLFNIFLIILLGYFHIKFY